MLKKNSGYVHSVSRLSSEWIENRIRNNELIVYILRSYTLRNYCISKLLHHKHFDKCHINFFCSETNSN